MNAPMVGPKLVVAAAMEFKPVAVFACLSGGADSVSLAHWAMENVPDCQCFHINTGIGIKRTTDFVRDFCAERHYPLTVIRSKEDCGQDYDQIVKRFGFPGPAGHRLMYTRLKERAVRLLVKRNKTTRLSKVMLLTGIRHDESQRRMGYGERVINHVGSQLWVNAIYWWTKQNRDAYISEKNLPLNPISVELGMSGECLCGAFAHPGEIEDVRRVCPETAARIERLQAEVMITHPWQWGHRPPRKRLNTDAQIGHMCSGCEKSSVVQKAINEAAEGRRVVKA